jgi:hypothetical protein
VTQTICHGASCKDPEHKHDNAYEKEHAQAEANRGEVVSECGNPGCFCTEMNKAAREGRDPGTGRKPNRHERRRIAARMRGGGVS